VILCPIECVGCRLLRSMITVSVSLSVTRVGCAKRAERINVQFVVMTPGNPRNNVSDGGERGKGNKVRFGLCQDNLVTRSTIHFSLCSLYIFGRIKCTMRPVATDDPAASFVSLFVTWLRCAKTAEPTEVLFRMETFGELRHTVLDGGPNPPTARRRKNGRNLPIVKSTNVAIAIAACCVALRGEWRAIRKQQRCLCVSCNVQHSATQYTFVDEVFCRWCDVYRLWVRWPSRLVHNAAFFLLLHRQRPVLPLLCRPLQPIVRSCLNRFRVTCQSPLTDFDKVSRPKWVTKTIRGA